MRVRHRHIIYIQGYDPRGLAQYYRMFRTELRKFSRLYQLSATISRPKVADDEIASWTIDTKATDWQTRTSYDFLRFEDLGNGRSRLRGRSICPTIEGRDALLSSGAEGGMTEGYEKLDELLTKTK